ncbi:MAG: proline dehydrogenase [Ignavibacteriae bacterium]|nr:MAG: proline dehydrogenase [Ignavibacteriota bacterium]
MPLLNKIITTAFPFIPKSIVGQVAKRYIAGVALSDGIRQVKELNKKTIMATMDLLGEDVKNNFEIEEVKAEILSILQAIEENKLTSNVSLKPTQLGLKIDKELAYRNIKKIVETAKNNGNFVRIDMEDAATTDDTLAIYRRLQSDGLDNTGVVIQAYLHRSEEDVRSLVKSKANIRLCKGIYNESPGIAYKDRHEIRNNYLKLLNIILEGGSYVGIATHDDFLIDHAHAIISKFGLNKDQYEYQMLLGVREKRRDQIVNDGHRIRIYVPFGEQWYAYSSRRLQENPQMAWYITKAIFIRQ